MDRTEHYKELVKQVMQELLDEMATFTPEEGVRTEAQMDDANGHYQVMELGWSMRRRVHGLLFHCDVRDGKIHVEHDGTSFGIVDLLMKRGVPATDLVLGWHPPYLRHLTPFAAA